MKHTLLILLALIILIMPNNTVLAGNMEDGASAANSVIGKVNQSAPLSSDPKQSVPGFVTGSPSETNYSNGDISGAATQKALTDPASQLINKSFSTRPVITIDRNTSPIFKKAGTVTDNPNAIITNLTSKYGECTTKSPVTTISSDTRTCDEYTETSEQTCQVGQVVIVDAKHNYQCNRSRVYNDYTCNRSLTLTCAVQGCDAGVFSQIVTSYASGVISTQSPANAISWNYIYPTLNIGGNWSNGSGLFCSSGGNIINFNISNISSVTKFLLTKATYKSTINVILNGTTILSESGATVQNTQFKRCTIPVTSLRTQNLSINLLPYLRQGNNTLSITGLSSYGSGSANITIDTAQQCCASWTESWTDSCGVYK